MRCEGPVVIFVCRKVVDTGTGDPRDGSYSLNGSNANLPLFCGDDCVYTKDGSSPDDLYCFGPGDVDSTCSAPVTDPVAPEGAPEADRGETGEGAPPGEYYFNRYPGQENRALLCGESLSLLTEDRMNKLDLALENGPEDSGMFSTSLRFERIDGPSSGQVKFSHLLAIMATASTGAMFRLEIRGETGSSSDSATTR